MYFTQLCLRQDVAVNFILNLVQKMNSTNEKNDWWETSFSGSGVEIRVVFPRKQQCDIARRFIIPSLHIQFGKSGTSMAKSGVQQARTILTRQNENLQS